MRHKSLLSDWLIGTTNDPDKRDEIRNTILASTTVFEQFSKILDQQYKQLESQERDYSDAAWAFKQAHLNGKRDVLEYFRKLIP